MVIKIGTRRSALAKAQANLVKTLLEEKGFRGILVEVESFGDKNLTKPLYEYDISEPGIFTKQLEARLLDDSIDIAVHSLKDLPTEQPPGLFIHAVLKREVSGDVLIIHPKAYAEGNPIPLRAGTKVGTSSLRREAQLCAHWNNLNIVPIRGNVPTRVQAVRDGKVQATVLAAAGLKRLELSLEGLIEFPLPSFIPAPGQGAIAIEARTEIPNPLKTALSEMHHQATGVETSIERRILNALAGGCTLPLGVRCKLGSKIHLQAFLGHYETLADGRRKWLSFDTFDSYSEDEATLILDTVKRLKK